MICHFCYRAAAAKCLSCGQPICTEHGAEYCPSCAGAVYSRETNPTGGMGKGYLQVADKPAMPTVYIDDDGPPSCYRCGGLAREVCLHCEQLFCPEHAGSAQWCDQCARSVRVGSWTALAILGGMAALTMLFFLLNQMQTPR